MKYSQVHDGEWIRPKTMKGHRMACCDCGLTHVFDFVVVGKGKNATVLYRAKRDKRATNRRRQKLQETR